MYLNYDFQKNLPWKMGAVSFVRMVSHQRGLSLEVPLYQKYNMILDLEFFILPPTTTIDM